MKDVLISSFDMEVGGVERSLINMLENFDYKSYDVDLMLYRHQGELMKLLPQNHNLINEVEEYTTFRKSISEVIKEKKLAIGIARLIAKCNTSLLGKLKGIKESGYYQMQLMWKYAMPFLPTLGKTYDIAISYLWPHYFVAEKVTARRKIAWIHTDYSTIEVDTLLDLKMWNKFNYIISISEACTEAFLKKYPSLKNKIVLVENITSPLFVRQMSLEVIEEKIEKDSNFKIVSVGRLCYQKGFDIAIKALKLLKDKGIQNITWYVVGYGGDEAMLSELINKNDLKDSFILLGKKLNPYPYMKACDLYVQPSRYEGKAVTIAEAQILGKPVLITDYPTAKSQIREGFDGVITDLSIEGIADGIERLYNDKSLRDLLGSNSNNSSYSNINELEKLYQLMVEGN